MATIRCCVLGATGFIGGQIARAALERGWLVRGVRRRPDAVGALEDVTDRVEWVQADLADRSSLVTALRGCPLVFHAAAYYPQRSPDLWEAIRHGVSGMRNLLDAARTAGVRRLVYTSSLSTIGPPSEPGRLANEGDLYMPGTAQLPYFEVKWAMEQEALRASAQGLPVIVAVPSLVFGPGDVKPTSSQLLLLVARRRLRWAVEGSVNVVDGRDVGVGHTLAAERGKPGRRYILGGHNVTYHEMLTDIAQAADVPPPKRKLPMSLVETAGKIGRRLGVSGAGQLVGIRHWQPLDTSHARQALGLPEPYPFEETCRDTLAWFREHGYVNED
jgi:dihydroflavonol-4-reductase